MYKHRYTMRKFFSLVTTRVKGLHAPEIPLLTQIIYQDVVCLEKWCKENGMFISTWKTKSMLVIGKRLQNQISINSIDASLNGTGIEQVNNYKLLGIVLD